MGKGSYSGFSWIDILYEWNNFFFWADHAHDGQVVCKLQLGNPFKALLQVWLHSEGVLCFRQDLQKLIIWQEEEPNIK